MAALATLRGIDFLAAVTLVAEIGDFQRFAHPRDLMGFLGLVPSEFSTGETRHRGSITKTGNGHARRVLIEAAWNYRHSARISRLMPRPSIDRGTRDLLIRRGLLQLGVDEFDNAADCRSNPIIVRAAKGAPRLVERDRVGVLQHAQLAQHLLPPGLRRAFHMRQQELQVVGQRLDGDLLRFVERDLTLHLSKLPNVFVVHTQSPYRTVTTRPLARSRTTLTLFAESK